MTAREIDREARRVWDGIVAETHTRRFSHAGKISRLYNVARDLQQAARDGASLRTLRAVVEFLNRVLNHSFAQAVR